MTNELAYTGLKSTELKDSQRSVLAKNWGKVLSNMGLPIVTDITVDLLGTDWFYDTYQSDVTPVTEDGLLSEGYQFFKMGELADSRRNEAELVQFDVTPSKAANVLFDPTLGMLKTQQLYQHIEIGQVNDEYIVIGGRHRLTAILTLLKKVEGWEDMNIVCRVLPVVSVDAAINMILASNGSRSMTATEKTLLKSARSGLTTALAPEELLSSTVKSDSLTDHKRASLLYFVTAAESESELANVTADSLGKIGNAYLGNIAKLIEGLQKGGSKLVLNFKHEGQKVVAMLIEYGFTVMTQTWQDILTDIAVPVIDRKTGKVRVDDTTLEPVMSINIARSTARIAQLVADNVYNALEDELKAVLSTANEQEAQNKKAKMAEKITKTAATQAQQATNIAEFLKNSNFAVPPELIAQLEAKAKEAAKEAQEAAKLAETVAPTTNQEVSSLSAWLS